MRFNRLILPLTMTIILAGVFCLAVPAAAETGETKEATELKWLKYDKGLELAAKENKPLMVDFYTDWCKFCKKMDKETFTDGAVAKYLHDNFVLVKVNAESNEAVATSEGSLSEKELSRSFGVRGYPAYWFLKSNGEKISNFPGYAPADKFIMVLRYFGEGHYETTTWKDFLSSQKSD